MAAGLKLIKFAVAFTNSPGVVALLGKPDFFEHYQIKFQRNESLQTSNYLQPLMRSPEYTNTDHDFIAHQAERPKESEVSRALIEVEQLMSKVSELPLNKKSTVLSHLREARALLLKEAEFKP